ncbi:uncharacterized protein LOC130629036 [Hydractinia symbiolongicarpus]|uniref:uncharacterized protein LOC130629036 n=1 Tax=Hydractinia symbiolongicarpus TaxID=13093 RepID=UPI002551450C|nr:uncharacterized protein LOC130629036 [Hydractinia symbiolongicarpus]
MFRDLWVLCLVFIFSNCKIDAIQKNQTQNETLEVCRKEYFVAKFVNSNTSITKEELVNTKHCAHNANKTNLQNTLSIIYVFNTALKKYFYWLRGELVQDAADWGSVLFVTNDFETITQYYNFGQEKVKAYQEFIPVTAGSNYTFMLFSIPSNRHTLQLNMKAPGKSYF